jgi:hypothetical protein
VAIRRACFFFAAWIVALMLLPAQWVAVAALVWAIVVTPGVIEIHRQFQHEPDP